MVTVTSCFAALAISKAHWMTCWVTSCMSGPVPPSEGIALLHSLWSRNALEVNKRREPRTVSERGFCTKKERTHKLWFCCRCLMSKKKFFHAVLIPLERVPPFQSQPHVFFLSRVWSCEEERVCDYTIIMEVLFHQRASAMLFKLPQGHQCCRQCLHHTAITSLFFPPVSFYHAPFIN